MSAKRSLRQLWTAKLKDQLSDTTKPKGKPLASISSTLLKSTACSLRKASSNDLGRSFSSFRGCILGVDPSLRKTGIAIIDYQGRDKIHLVHSRALPFKSSIPFASCLAEIAKVLSEWIQTYPVQHVALEQTIFVQNHKTAQTLGAVRGAIIATAALRGLPVFEYPPLRIKQALTGFGRASKEQLAKTVAQILKIPFNFSLDEGDAAAAALCHAFTHKL